MASLQASVKALESGVSGWGNRNGSRCLRWSLGIVFLWFGVLKFFPGLSPAEALAVRTTRVLTFGLVPDTVCLFGVAALECVIGLGFLTGIALPATLLLLGFHMIGAAAPLVIFPTEMFTQIPYAGTLEGQYIIKNLVLISAGIALAGTLRDNS